MSELREHFPYVYENGHWIMVEDEDCINWQLLAGVVTETLAVMGALAVITAIIFCL